MILMETVIYAVFFIQIMLYANFLLEYRELEGTGAYCSLLLAPVEGLGSPLDPLPSGGNLF